jgi:hypothetical protein
MKKIVYKIFFVYFLISGLILLVISIVSSDFKSVLLGLGSLAFSWYWYKRIKNNITDPKSFEDK